MTSISRLRPVKAPGMGLGPAGQDRAASENWPPPKLNRCACPAGGGHWGEPLPLCSGPVGREARLSGTPAVQGAVGSKHRVPAAPQDPAAAREPA